MFVAVRQFASASGTEELKEVHVRLPANSEIAPDGTEVFPATVWTKNKLLILKGYYASTDGNIWSRNHGNTLKKLSIDKKQRVGLMVDGKKLIFYVHRILASTFLSCIRHPGQTEVDHLDIDSQNNALANLRWCTKRQNAGNKCATKKEATGKRVGELSSKPVQQLCPQNGSVIAEFSSLTAAAAALGISFTNISNAIAGRQKTAGGFSWQFAPREVTLENFKNRGFEVVGGLEEAPHVYFSADLRVYNDGAIGKMYEIPTAHGHEYPFIRIGKSLRLVHVVVAALRMNHKSLAAFDEFLASKNFVVMHDGDADKSDWWNCKVGTPSENALDAVRNGCTAAGKSAPRPVEIRLSPSPTADIWKYGGGGHDGGRDAKFSSFSEAARALTDLSDLKHLKANICQSARTGCSFSLKNGQKAWAFYA
jgi:hypothetical protein